MSMGQASGEGTSGGQTQGHQASASGGGFLAPPATAQPHDRCFRCGKETPAGVGLCEEHNPRGMRGPSATQMHATIFGGIALGFLGFILIANLAVGTTGPFAADVTTAAALPDGGASIAFTITNEGAQDGVPDCRVTLDGVARPEDLSFRAEKLPAGETVSLERVLDPPGGPVGYVPDKISVVCG